MGKKNKIVIFGSSGYIGSHLVTAFGNNYEVKTTSFSKKQQEKNLQIDLSDLEQVRSFSDYFSDFNIFIFLVGLAHSKGKSKDLKQFKKINYHTLINTLQEFNVFKRKDKKIIFASTISVYGENINQDIFYEDSAKNPLSPYAITKLSCEKFLADKFFNQTWVLRLAPVYSSKFSLNIDRRTKIGNLYYRVGDGSQKLSLCNMKNISTVISSIIKEKVPHGTYNIADEREYTYNDLLKFNKGKFIIRIPLLFLSASYYFGLIIKNIFLIENSIKLLKSNVYSSAKISRYIKLPYYLKN